MHQLNMKIQGFYSVEYIRDVLQRDENVKIGLISTFLKKKIHPAASRSFGGYSVGKKLSKK